MCGVAVARDAPEERLASGRWIAFAVFCRRRLHSWLYHNLHPLRSLNPLRRQEFTLEDTLTVMTIDSTTTVRRGARAEHEARTSHGMVRGEGAAGRRARVAPLSCSLHAPRPGSPCAANEPARHTWSEEQHVCARAAGSPHKPRPAPEPGLRAPMPRRPPSAHVRARAARLRGVPLAHPRGSCELSCAAKSCRRPGENVALTKCKK